MLESDFCNIIDVQDCEVGKYNACVCTKVMVFGADEVNGKICERFTTRATSRNCYDGNLKLAQEKCITTSEAGLCEEILIDKNQQIIELLQENEILKGELNSIKEVLDLI